MVGVDQDLVRRIGSNIERARLRARLTVGQLADALGISADMVRELEGSQSDAYDRLDLITFLRLAQYVGSPATLILSQC